VALVDGRPELADEVASEREDVRDAVRDGLAGLLGVAHVATSSPAPSPDTVQRP